MCIVRCQGTQGKAGFCVPAMVLTHLCKPLRQVIAVCNVQASDAGDGRVNQQNLNPKA